MIKTHSGKLIEPRVGDVVECNQEPAKVKNVYKGYRISLSLLDKDLCGEFKESDCTLLHRPFKVGDPVQYEDVDENGSYWQDAIITNIMDDRICVSNGRDFVEFKINSGLLRHKDEALRDHPDYKPSKQSE